jgi:hypothetical protein
VLEANARPDLTLSKYLPESFAQLAASLMGFGYEADGTKRLPRLVLDFNLPLAVYGQLPVAVSDDLSRCCCCLLPRRVHVGQVNGLGRFGSLSVQRDDEVIARH